MIIDAEDFKVLPVHEVGPPTMVGGEQLYLLNPSKFLEKFGAPVEKIDELVKAKTVTISKLMEIAPEGTLDPTPSLYNTTMYAMAGLLIIAFFSNLLMKPVHSKHYVENTHPGTLK